METYNSIRQFVNEKWLTPQQHSQLRTSTDLIKARWGIFGIIIQLQSVEYKQHSKRVQTSHGICTPEDPVGSVFYKVNVAHCKKCIVFERNKQFVRVIFVVYGIKNDENNLPQEQESKERVYELSQPRQHQMRKQSRPK